MRTLTRNQKTAYYQLYLGTDEETDANGNYTGERVESYGEKTEFRANIFIGSESAFYQPYGIQEDTSITLYMEKDLGFSETTILWIGNTDRANYIVTSVADNLNGVVVKAKVMK